MVKINYVSANSDIDNDTNGVSGTLRIELEASTYAEYSKFVEEFHEFINARKSNEAKTRVKKKKNVKIREFTNIEELKEYLKTAKNTNRTAIKGITDLSNLFNDPIFHDKPYNFFLGVRSWDYSDVTDISSMFENCKNARIDIIRLKNLSYNCAKVKKDNVIKGTNTTEEYLEKLDKWCRGVLGGENRGE